MILCILFKQQTTPDHQNYYEIYYQYGTYISILLVRLFLWFNNSTVCARTMYVHGLCHPAQVSSPMTDMNVILFLGENLLVSHLNCFIGVVATLAADYNDDQNYHRRKSNKVVLLREVFIMVSSAHSLELLPFRSAARKQDKMNSNSSRHRINAALMPKFHGRQVCLLGKAKDVSKS